MSKTKKFILMLITIFCITSGILYFLGLAYCQTHFKMGTTINGFRCSFKSLEETEALLSREVESYAMAVYTRNNGVEKLSAKNVGMTFNGRQELIDALKKQDYKLWFIPASENIVLNESCYDIDEEKLNNELDSLKCMNNIVQAESAHIVETNDFYQVAPSVKGNEIDKLKAKSLLETAIRQWKDSIDLEAAGCYIDAEEVDEEVLEAQCDVLNSIQETIITYDFGDRTETVDYKKIKKEFLNSQYQLDMEKIKKFVSKMAKKYDTVGSKRKFITFDDKTVELEGGDYGWIIDIDKTAEEMISLIKENTIDVVKPIYKQEALSRKKNDIGYSYVEVNTEKDIVVLYVDGKPQLQTIAKFNGKMEPGFFKVSSKQDITDNGQLKAIKFGNSLLYQYEKRESAAYPTQDNPLDFTESGIGDSVSGMTTNGVLEGCLALEAQDIDKIYNTVQEGWPIIIN